jgi:hypothetical protein
MRQKEGPLVNIDGRLAFLDLLLEMEQNEQINEEDIQNEVFSFLMELWMSL